MGAPTRRPPSEDRQAIIHKFSVGGITGHITAGMYPDGTVCEIYIQMAKMGSALQGLLDSFSIAFSLALQYGVPLKELTERLKGTRYEPNGFTNNPEIPISKSISDYLARWLEDHFLQKKLE